MKPFKTVSAWALFLVMLPWSVSRSENSQALTVCRSGCQYTNVQAAIDAASDGAVIELQAGQTFTGNLVIVGKNRLTIRSSRWQELPELGYRVDPVQHDDLLATVLTPNTDPALEIGTGENNIAQNGVDVENDTITFDDTDHRLFRFKNGMEVTCATPAAIVLPEPLTAGNRYFIRDWDSSKRRGRLAETADGPPIDLKTTGTTTGSNYYSRPPCVRWEQPTGIRIDGIRFAVGGKKAPRLLVRIGHNVEPRPVETGPNAELHHVVITGRQNDATGPLFCLALFGGRDYVVRDSWIGHCKALGDESKGISIQNVVGAAIQNNYVSAASINLLTGGGDAASMDVSKNLVITGNFFEKPGYMMYKEAAGEPSGECYYGGGSGAFYRRADITPNTCQDGACYTCGEDFSWQQDTSAYYRSSHYLTKNLLELKDCEDCRVEGNLLRGSYGGPDTGQGWCYGISVITSPPGQGGGSGYHRAHNVTIRNNWGDACYTGLQMTNSVYAPATFDQVPLKNIVVENNLFTNMGWYPALTQWVDPQSVQRFGLKQSSGIHGFRFVNNTIRARSDYGVGVVLYEGRYPDRAMSNYYFNNNIISFTKYSFLLDSMLNACAPDGLFRLIPPDGTTHFRNNLFYGGPDPNTFLSYAACQPVVERVSFEKTDAAVGFISPTNHRLNTSSRYSAANSAAALVSADTNTDLGADIDTLEQYVIPAERGVPSMPEQLQVQVSPGSRTATIAFRRPDKTTCEVSVYSQRARSAANEIADTHEAGLRKDGRTSSTVDGAKVQFVAGAVSPLVPRRPYWYQVQCGSLRAIGQFRTTAPSR